MKKLGCIITFICAISFSVNAQEIADHAIGLRLGHNNGVGAEISYQHKLNSTNRIEADLGIGGNSNYSSFKLTGIYQWVWELENKFNWYAGFGGGIGSWNEKETNSSDTIFYGSGDIGIEYNFDIPLLISLDYRPEIGFIGNYKGFQSNIALGLRYRF